MSLEKPVSTWQRFSNGSIPGCIWPLAAAPPLATHRPRAQQQKHPAQAATGIPAAEQEQQSCRMFSGSVESAAQTPPDMTSTIRSQCRRDLSARLSLLQKAVAAVPIRAVSFARLDRRLDHAGFTLLLRQLATVQQTNARSVGPRLVALP